MTKSLHKAQWLVFNRAQYEAFSSEVGAGSDEQLHVAVMADRRRLDCLARLELRTKIDGGRWSFEVLRDIGTRGFSHDHRDGPNGLGSILYIEQDSNHSNIARVVDFTNSGSLEGTGINSWLLAQARENFELVAGPDPWISGSLSHQDKDNARRLPFWQRHVDGNITVDAHGEGSFEGPWLQPFNPYRCSAALHLEKEQGSLPHRDTASHGALYWNGQRLSFKVPDDRDTISRGRHWTSAFS